MLTTTHFDSSQALADTLTRHVRLYNHQVPQKTLGHIAPVQALKGWEQNDPQGFKKNRSIVSRDLTVMLVSGTRQVDLHVSAQLTKISR